MSFGVNLNSSAQSVLLSSFSNSKVIKISPGGHHVTILTKEKIGKISSISHVYQIQKNLPFDAEIYSELGICYLGLGNCCKSAKHFIKAIKLDPNNTDTQIQLAVAHEIMCEEDMAIMIYQKIMETNPDCEKAYIQKASLLMQVERYNEAIDVFSDILTLNPDYYRSYLGIGICLDKLGETVKAKRYYKRYLRLMPDAPNAKNVIKRLEDILKASLKHENFLKIV